MGSGPPKDWKPVYLNEASGRSRTLEPHPQQQPGWPDAMRKGVESRDLTQAGSGDAPYAGPPDPLRDDRLGDAPRMRFVRLTERLARPRAALGQTVLDACKEVWARVRPCGEDVLAPREEIAQAAAERLARAAMPRFEGRVIIASRRELVPRPKRMEEGRGRQALKERLQILEGGGSRNVNGLMIDGVFPAAARRFDIPARMAVDSSGRRTTPSSPARTSSRSCPSARDGRSSASSSWPWSAASSRAASSRWRPSAPSRSRPSCPSPPR